MVLGRGCGGFVKVGKRGTIACTQWYRLLDLYVCVCALIDERFVFQLIKKYVDEGNLTNLCSSLCYKLKKKKLLFLTSFGLNNTGSECVFVFSLAFLVNLNNVPPSSPYPSINKVAIKSNEVLKCICRHSCHKAH